MPRWSDATRARVAIARAPYMRPIFDLYKGGKLIGTGNYSDLSRLTGLSEMTLKCYRVRNKKYEFVEVE